MSSSPDPKSSPNDDMDLIAPAILIAVLVGLLIWANLFFSAQLAEMEPPSKLTPTQLLSPASVLPPSVPDSAPSLRPDRSRPALRSERPSRSREERSLAPF